MLQLQQKGQEGNNFQGQFVAQCAGFSVLKSLKVKFRLFNLSVGPTR